MVKTKTATKYRIINSFTYKGPEGEWKQKQWKSLGPGESVPKMSKSIIRRLLVSGVICEVDLYGENIPYKKFIEMNGEEISRLFEGKLPQAIINIIAASNFGPETLNRMLAYSEKMRLPEVPKYIERRLGVE